MSELKKYTKEITISNEERLKDKNPEYKSMTLFQYLQKKYHDIFKDNNDSIWLFKGHSSLKWTLKTDFERAVKKYYGNECNINGNNYDIEQEIIREFKRKSPYLLDKIPEEENILEWLSLMRHHGAPCRLLDLTYSFYVALYFAIEKMEFYDPKEGKETDNNENGYLIRARYAIIR